MPQIIIRVHRVLLRIYTFILYKIICIRGAAQLRTDCRHLIKALAGAYKHLNVILYQNYSHFPGISGALNDDDDAPYITNDDSADDDDDYGYGSGSGSGCKSSNELRTHTNAKNALRCRQTEPIAAYDSKYAEQLSEDYASGDDDSENVSDSQHGGAVGNVINKHYDDDKLMHSQSTASMPSSSEQAT